MSNPVKQIPIYSLLTEGSSYEIVKARASFTLRQWVKNSVLIDELNALSSITKKHLPAREWRD